MLIQSMRAQSPPVSFRQIAQQLGVSVGKVQRELARANLEAMGGGSAAPAGAMFESPLGLDSELREHRKRLEMGRLELAGRRMELDRAELDQRMAMLQQGAAGGKGGDSSAMVAMLLGELNRLRDQIARPQSAGHEGLIDTLSQFREVGEIVKAMAPPPSMSGREGLEFNIALERIRSENERIMREREAEISIRRRQVEGQAARDDALAKMIEQFGPVVAAAAQRYVEQHMSGAAGQPSPPPASATPGLPAAGSKPSGSAEAGDASSAGRGHCPRCNYPPGDQDMELIPTGAEDRCPGCGAGLAVAEGRIVLAGAEPAAARANGHGPGELVRSFTS